MRAAAASRIPLISAIGHETDWTLLDHVADRRAPTPTGAAEMAVPVRAELVAAVEELAARHYGATLRLVEASRRELRGAVRALPNLDDLLAIPRRRFDETAGRLGRALFANARAHRLSFERAAARLSATGLARSLERAGERFANLAQRHQRALSVELRQKRSELSRSSRRFRVEPLVERLAVVGRRLAETSERSRNAFRQDVERRLRRVMALDQLLRSLSYENVLARGYAVVRDASYTPIPSKAGLTSGAALDIQFRDGHIGAVAGPALPRPRRKKSDPGDQGL